MQQAHKANFKFRMVKAGTFRNNDFVYMAFFRNYYANYTVCIIKPRTH